MHTCALFVYLSFPTFAWTSCKYVHKIIDQYMKKIYYSLALVASLGMAHAGGYLTNTNQSVAFLRNPARNASTSIEALYSNPAGVAFLPEGWHLSLSLQSAYQSRDIESLYKPFARNADGHSTSEGLRRFQGRASAPALPSLTVAYKQGRWTFGGHVAFAGGGGRAKYKGGLPSFEAPISLIPGLITASGLATGGRYQYDTYMRGTQYLFSATVGAAYRITADLSAYVGMRVSLASNYYSGYIRNLQAELNGTMTPLNSFFTSRAAAALSAGQVALSRQLSAYAAMTADRELDVSQSGMGLAPILGVNYRLGKLHLAAKYEFKTNVTVENDTKVNTVGLAAYNDGVKTENDVPALLSLGASYSIAPRVKVMAGYHHYFDKDAGMAGAKQRLLDGNTQEYLAGVEWDVTKRLMLSLGGQLTRYGQSDAFQSDLSFHCDSYSLGFGGTYQLSKTLKLQFAYFFTDYSDYTRQLTPYTASAPAIAGRDTYKRTNHVFGLGLDLSL